MHTTKTFRRKRELQVGFDQDMGHISLICFRTAVSPYGAFVQIRNIYSKYIFSRQTHPSMAWRAEYGLGFIPYSPPVRT